MAIVETTAPSPNVRRDNGSLFALPPRVLAALAIDFATIANFDLLDEPQPGERSSLRVHLGATHDIWLIRWGVGSRTELHDHGGSSGALHVVKGELVEHLLNPAGGDHAIRRVLHELDSRPMSALHVHEVANEASRIADSVHVYSPPLETMNNYDPADDTGRRVIRSETIDAGLPASK